MKTIIFRGPILTESGYGVHARGIARWLLTLKNVNVRFNLTPWGMTSWILDRDEQNGLIGEIMDRSVDAEHPCDIMLMLQLPNEWAKTAPVRIGITAGVETDICNPGWIDDINQMSQVIVPSNHVKTTFETTAKRSGKMILTPIDVVQESFPDECLWDTNILPEFPNLDTKFNFLIVGQLTGQNALNDRKNTLNTIKWLCEEFKNDKDVGIVVKTNVGTNSAFDKQQTRAFMGKLMNEVKRSEFPKVHLIHGTMTDAELASMYKNGQIKALVSATRGEGFGLPLLEAAACGLPVIATNWSGHLDFMNNGKFVSFTYNLAPVHQSRIDGNIFVPGSMWAEVNEVDFKKKVRKFYTAHLTPKTWAIELKNKLKNMNSFDAISRRYEDVLGRYL